MDENDLIPIRCPGLVYKYNPETHRKEFLKCDSLLFKLSKGGKCETVCRRCKSKITAIVKMTLDDSVSIEIRQRQND